MTAFIFMRTHSAVVVVVWAGCSALCVSMIAYLGTGSPDNGPWLAAGVAGAVLGAAAARWRGQKGGSLLMGLLFGVLLAVGYSLWHGP